MNLENVKEELELIKDSKGDYEAAHSIEKTLWGSVLVQIADGAENAEQLAEEALKSRDIEFKRYMA